MAYFVTGATGFIGQFLVANLLKRGEPVYVLVRKASLKKLAAQRAAWGADDKQLIAVTGDLGMKNLGVADADVRKLKGKITHFFHLAAIYDLGATAEAQQAATSDSAALPPGWAEVPTGAGSVYWANAETGESSWSSRREVVVSRQWQPPPHPRCRQGGRKRQPSTAGSTFTTKMGALPGIYPHE